MNLLTKLRHALLGRPQPKVTRLDSPDSTAMRIDELPPLNLHIADLMRYDPQVRIGLGARNGLLMAAQVEVLGDNTRIYAVGVFAWIHHLEWFFAFVLIPMNAAMVVLWWWQRRADRRFLHSAVVG